jgi:hypothetical protein
MDNDIKKWLAHINKSTGRKRKRDDNDDTMLNELTYKSIDSIIEILTENEINTTELNDMLDDLEIIYYGTKHVFNNDPNIKNNKNMYLLLSACISISLDIISKLREEKSKTKRFNPINFLNKYKKKFFVPESQRKLGNVKIKLDSVENLQDDSEEELTTEDKDYESEDGEEDGEEDDEEPARHGDQQRPGNRRHGLGQQQHPEPAEVGHQRRHLRLPGALGVVVHR